MYDIVIVRKLNKKKVILVVILVILIISMPTVLGIKVAQIKEEERQKIARKEEEEKQANLIKQQEIEKQKQEAEKQAIIQGYVQKTSQLFNEEQKNNVLNIYNSEMRRVFLTFDDGPSESVTPLILDILKEQNVKATFFVLGRNVENYPEIVKRAFEEGHYIANHGYSHKSSVIYCSPQSVLDEYNLAEEKIRNALNNPNYHSNVFRFPGGSNGGCYHDLKQEAKALLRDNGIVHLDWNSLSRDAEGVNTKEELMQNIIDTSSKYNNVVVLMHDTADKILTYEILTDVINYFRTNGYEFQNIYDII